MNSGIISPVSILYDDLGNPIPLSLDAFQRLRVSEPTTIFDSKQIFFSPALYFTGFTSDGGSSVYDHSRSSTLLSTTTTLGSTAIRQSKRYFNYQPGKSFKCFITFVATDGGVAGTKKSIGYFDGYDGIFFSLNGTTPEVTIRSSVSGIPTDNSIIQANWNKDKFDGTGPSGITVDFSKTQILFIDFEWLGVGSARIGFIIDGRIYIAHQFNHANVEDSVYMQSPNLPVRWEITGTGAASSLECICCSVASEGGRQLVGLTRSVDRGSSGKDVSQVSPEQLIAIRLQSAYNRATVFPSSINIIQSGNAVGTRWFLCLNPTVGGAAVWTPVPNSAIEFDINLTAQGSRVISAFGTVLASGYFTNDTSSIGLPLDDVLTLAADYAGVSDILVLGVQRVVGTGNETYFASLSWKEPT